MPSFFAKQLLSWHQQNPRLLPWADGSRNTYMIWLSEIIMQQTRIEQGTSYYMKFVDRYPTVSDLSAAPLDDVLHLWEGLGYYTRARNLHTAANRIVHDLDGHFPDSYDALLDLPGVGPYSAAAIASFAYGHRHVVVDGNVKRLISRFAGIAESIDNPNTHKKIHAVATGYMKGVPPDIFNQAIMNFGALVCKPKPLCNICPLIKKCFAYQHKMISELPVRSKKKELRNRFFNFVMMQHNDSVLMQRRSENDIWKDLYSFPFLEKKSTRAPLQNELTLFVTSLIGNKSTTLIEKERVLYQQLLSHQLIRGRFYVFEIKKTVPAPAGYSWIPINLLSKYGKPRMIVEYLKKKQLL